MNDNTERRFVIQFENIYMSKMNDTKIAPLKLIIGGFFFL